MASHWIEAGVIVAMFAALPFLIRASKKQARGRMGGAAMMLGLAFGALFDPAAARASEIVRKQDDIGHDETAGAAGDTDS